jgi:uncharacterized protein YggE
MNRKWLVVVAAAMILVVVGVAGCSSGGTTLGGDGTIDVNLNSQQEGIWVSGEGTVTAVPDVAILSLGIQAQETTVEEAQATAAEAMGKVMAALEDEGVAEEDIQTQHYSIYPVTRWDKDDEESVIIGYRVSNTVTAKVREIAETGAVIDAVAAAGGDYTRINSVGFDLDDPAEYYADARELAVVDAKAKAEQLAEVADVNLGKPTYISESSYVPGPIYRQDTVASTEAGAPSVETPISPGEMEITVNIQIAYAIVG